MGTQTTVSVIPDCDICANAIVPQKVLAYADASCPPLRGSWASVCRKHFDSFGCRLGTGAGQEYILRDAPEQSQDERIKENLKGVDLENISFEDFDELFEDRDPMEFL